VVTAEAIQGSTSVARSDAASQWAAGAVLLAQDAEHHDDRCAAVAAFDRGDLREALRLWRHVLAMSPRHKDALFQVACCHALLDEPAQACNAFLSVAADARADQSLRRRAAELARLVDPIAD
jgi:hypothetical protein